MSDNQLSRRQVLGALATTGGAGAIAGTGTSALFTDEETFTDNGIRASSSVAGVVDMTVDYNYIKDETGLKYEVTLPEGVNNNPSYVWFRADCPEEDERELACATNITVEVECDGDSNPETVESGSVRDVFNKFRNGTRLCDGDSPCLEVGETQTLKITIDGVDDWYDGNADRLTFNFEFYGEQCRYNTRAENPFDESSLDKCSCPSPDTDTQEVSWITFCVEGGEKPQPTDETKLINDQTAVDWKTKEAVDYVIVKTGQGGDNKQYIIYDYSSTGKSGGVAAVGDKDATLRDIDEVDGYDTNGEINQNPCAFAKDALGPDSGSSCKFVKWEVEDGELVVEEEEEGEEEGEEKERGNGGGNGGNNGNGSGNGRGQP